MLSDAGAAVLDAGVHFDAGVADAGIDASFPDAGGRAAGACEFVPTMNARGSLEYFSSADSPIGTPFWQLRASVWSSANQLLVAYEVPDGAVQFPYAVSPPSGGPNNIGIAWFDGRHSPPGRWTPHVADMGELEVAAASSTRFIANGYVVFRHADAQLRIVDGGSCIAVERLHIESY